jgi:hypothetical protein
MLLDMLNGMPDSVDRVADPMGRYLSRLLMLSR